MDGPAFGDVHGIMCASPNRRRPKWWCLLSSNQINQSYQKSGPTILYIIWNHIKHITHMYNICFGRSSRSISPKALEPKPTTSGLFKHGCLFHLVGCSLPCLLRLWHGYLITCVDHQTSGSWNSHFTWYANAISIFCRTRRGNQIEGELPEKTHEHLAQLVESGTSILDQESGDFLWTLSRKGNHWAIKCHRNLYFASRFFCRSWWGYTSLFLFRLLYLKQHLATSPSHIWRDVLNF